MRVAGLLVLAALTSWGSTAVFAEGESPDAQAKALYGTYLLERKDKSWGAFQRRLTALRQLGPLACDRARKSLLKVVRTARDLDDRILAAQGIARYGDLASVQELMATLAKKGHPVLTQVVGTALAATKDGEVIAWLSGTALELPDRQLGPVLRAHTELPTPEAAAALGALHTRFAASPTTIDLAYDALQALGRGRSELALSSIQVAAQGAEPRLRLAAADVVAFQDAEAPGVAETVRALLQDSQAVVKRAMADGIAAAEREVFVPDVTHLLDDEDPRTRKTAYDVLKRMTKKDFGFDAGAWRRWWEKRDTPDAPEPHTVPSYHGLPIFTENVVFVLDRSGSMRWPFVRTETARMEVAQAALVKVLGELSPRTRFNVIAFANKVFTWRKGESGADEKSVAKAVKWVKKQESKQDAGTNTYGVLQKAYEENPHVDTIYFLSDGIPEDGEITTSEGLLASVRDWNRYRRVQIHAIALTLQLTHPGKYPITGSMRRAASFMRDLARIGGGSYKHVERAPK